MGKYYIGLDISTSVVGVSIFDENGELYSLTHIDLGRFNKDTIAEERDIIKALEFKRIMTAVFNELSNDGVVESVFVEEPLPNTSVNINTTALLLGFNGMCRFIIRELLGTCPYKISVHESRMLFCPEFVKKTVKKGIVTNTLSFPKGWKSDEKKEYIRSKVEKLEPDFEWDRTKTNTYKPYCYDMSDAYCVGKAGLLILGVINS